MPTHLFFDAGNTLVHANMEVVSKALARRGVRRSAEELWKAEHLIRRVIDDPELIRRSTDAVRWKIYFTEIFKAAGVRKPSVVKGVVHELRTYHQDRNLWEIVPPRLPMALDLLRRRHRLAVISNSDGSVRRKLFRVGLLPYFDFVIDSHEEGIEKPDPGIFRIALERARVRPERALYVGDFYHIDVVGARAAGIDAVLIDPADLHGDRPVRRIREVADLLAPY